MPNDSWIYQGRQQHMWFGHGTAPRDTRIADLGPLNARIMSLAATAQASVPRSMRGHAALRFGDAEKARLRTAMRAWIGGLGLSRESFASILFGRSVDSEAVASLRKAATKVAAATTYADMREASDALGQGMRAVGLDSWSRFLISASEKAQASGLEPRVAAPSRPASPKAVTPSATSSSRAQRIAKLVKPGVDATQADIDAVTAYMLAHVPDAVLDMMEAHGITIYVTRGSVARQLGATPDTHARGPGDRGLGVVPAIYDKGRSRVIVATQDDGQGGRRMPDSREHGSVDAVLHEIGHGVDNRTSMWYDLSSRDDFTGPYEREGQSGAFIDPYYHFGSSGRSELWAEAFAMFMHDPSKMKQLYPNLFKYFEDRYSRKSK